MTTRDLADIFSGADNAEESGGGNFAPYLTPDDVPAGERINATVVYSSPDQTKAQYPKLNLKLRVDEGYPGAGSEFWYSWFLCGHDGTNKGMLKRADALGLTRDFMKSASTEAWAAAVKGKTVDVLLAWEEDKNGVMRVHNLNTSFRPVSDAPSGYVPGSSSSEVPEGF